MRSSSCLALVCVLVVLVAGTGGEGAGSVDDSSIVPEQAPLGEEIVKPPVEQGDATPVQRGGEVGGGAEQGSRPAAGDSGETEQEDEELMRRLEAFRAKKKAKQASKTKEEHVPQTASQETGATTGEGGGGEIAENDAKRDKEGGGGKAEGKGRQEAETRMEGVETKNDKPVQDGGKDGGGGGGGGGGGVVEGQGQGGRKSAKGSDSKSSRTGKLGGDVGAVEGIEDFEEELDTFEAAERAVNEKKRLEAAKEFARREAAAAQKLAKEQAEAARAEAAKAFNEQDMARRMGSKTGQAQKKVNQYQQECPHCHTVVVGARGRTARGVIERLLSIGEPVVAMARPKRKGVVDIPKWFADIMSKASYRGIQVKWIQGDVTQAESMRKAFKGAKAIVFCAAAKDGDLVEHSVNRWIGKGNKTMDMPVDVDYMGLKNVADEAVLAGARRLIILSSAGVARPLEPMHLLKRPLASILSGRLVWKRRGELAAIESCRASGFKTTYTVIRAGDLGESDWKDAYRVKPADAAFFQGDYVGGSVTRDVVAATAVESIFCQGARNVVLELTSFRERNRKSDDSPENAHNVWNEMFTALSAGAGGYRSYYDQMRDAVMADLRTWVLEAEEAKARIGAT